MRAYLNQMPTAAWVAVGIPTLLLAYGIVSTILPEVLRAVVPETVRAVLQML